MKLLYSTLLVIAVFSTASTLIGIAIGKFLRGSDIEAQRLLKVEKG